MTWAFGELYWYPPPVASFEIVLVGNLCVLRASVVIKARKPFHHGGTENTENAVGREIRRLPLPSSKSEFHSVNIMNSENLSLCLLKPHST